MLPDLVEQPEAVDAFDRRLAGRVDIGYHQMVGLMEAGLKFAEQALGPTVAVRLEKDHQPFFRPGQLDGICAGSLAHYTTSEAIQSYAR